MLGNFSYYNPTKLYFGEEFHVEVFLGFADSTKINEK